MSEIDLRDFLKKEAARNQRLACDPEITKNRRRTLSYRAKNHQRVLAEIDRLTAERDRLTEAMTRAVQSGHNLDCLFCGVKDLALTLALDQKADEDARDE